MLYPFLSASTRVPILLLIRVPRASSRRSVRTLLDAPAPGRYHCSMQQRLQDLASFTPQDIEAAIARNAPDEIPLVPLTVAMLSDDGTAAMHVCVRLARHDDPQVRANALISLGHLARRFRSLDEALVKPLVEEGLRDPDDAVRILAKSAADEIHQFLHWAIAGHVYGL